MQATKTPSRVEISGAVDTKHNCRVLYLYNQLSYGIRGPTCGQPMRYSRVIIRQQCAALLRFVDAVLEARRPCLVSVGGNWTVGSDPQGSDRLSGSLYREHALGGEWHSIIVRGERLKTY
jgi:hypothetical protein